MGEFLEVFLLDKDSHGHFGIMSPWIHERLSSSLCFLDKKNSLAYNPQLHVRQYKNQYNLLMAGSLVIVLPLVLYGVCNRYFRADFKLEESGMKWLQIIMVI